MFTQMTIERIQAQTLEEIFNLCLSTSRKVDNLKKERPLFSVIPKTQNNPIEETELLYVKEGTIVERTDGRFQAEIYIFGEQRQVTIRTHKTAAVNRLNDVAQLKKEGKIKTLEDFQKACRGLLKPSGNDTAAPISETTPSAEPEIFQFPGKPAYTFYSWLDLWLPTYKSHVGKKYYGILKSCIKCHIKKNIPDFPLGEEHGIEIKQGLNKIPSARNLETAYSILRESSAPAITQGFIKNAFIENIKPPRIVRKVGTAFRRTEQELFVEAIQSSPMRDAFLFQLFTGCRPGESRRAKRKHFDLERETVFLDGTKNEFAKRTIPLFAFLRKLIEKIPDDGRNFLFPFSEKSMAEEFARIMTICKFERVYDQYTLRHTFATRMAEKGVDIKTLAAWLGHNNTDTTQKYYLESQPEHHAAIRTKVDDTF